MCHCVNFTINVCVADNMTCRRIPKLTNYVELPAISRVTSSVELPAKCVGVVMVLLASRKLLEVGRLWWKRIRCFDIIFTYIVFLEICIFHRVLVFYKLD